MPKRLTPPQRKTALAIHVLLSVGWFGAVVAYLALALTGLTGSDRPLVAAAYVSMEVLAWQVIAPLSLLGLASGLFLSAFTEWGLLRHYWVVAKLAMTVVGTAVLFAHLPRIREMAELVKDASIALPVVDPPELQAALVVHAAGGLVLLTAVAWISVFKPWGRLRS